MPGPRGWEGRQGVGSLWPLGGPLGGAASALYTAGDTLSLLHEIVRGTRLEGRGSLRSASLETAQGVCRAKGAEVRQASSSHAYSEGSLGRMPSQILTRVPVPPYPQYTWWGGPPSP